MKKLPGVLTGKDILHQNTENAVIDVWTKFATLYFAVITNFQDTASVEEAHLFTLARDWVLLFLSLEGRRKGYERERITPYMHMLVYHVPKLSLMHIGIKQFSAQGMEKLNDIVKSNMRS